MQPNKFVTVLAILLILTPGMVFIFAPRLVADAVIAVEQDDVWLVSDAARAFHAEIDARSAAPAPVGR
jgi:hypothetical protein